MHAPIFEAPHLSFGATRGRRPRVAREQVNPWASPDLGSRWATLTMAEQHFHLLAEDTDAAAYCTTVTGGGDFGAAQPAKRR